MIGAARQVRTWVAIAAAAVLVLVASPAEAHEGADSYASSNSCGGASNLGGWTQLSGNLHGHWTDPTATDDFNDWAGHDSQANRRTFTLSGGPDDVDLEVWDSACVRLLCGSWEPGTAPDSCSIDVKGLVKVRANYFDVTGSGVGTSNYTLQVLLPPQCQDGTDNDGDGLADYPLDPGCSDENDATESPNPPLPSVVLLGCDDGLDNDADGRTDTTDPGCSGPSDPDERGITACDDGADNDGDLRRDYPADAGCTGPSDTDETDAPRSACADGVDNDLDTAVDYPNDPGCSSPTDTDERGAGACDNGADNDGDGQADYPADPGCAGPWDGNERGSTLPCDDGLDNDADGVADYPNDSGCRLLADPNETTIP